MYDLSFLDNSTGMTDIYTGANTQTNGFLAIGILIMIYAIAFMSLKRYESKAVFLVVSFVTTFIAGIFYALKWINDTVIWIFITLLLIALVVNIFGRD